MASSAQDALVALRRIMRAAEFSSRAISRQAGLTPSQMVLLKIIESEGEPGAGVIAARARLTNATVTALIDRLESKALVVRKRDAVDRRRIYVSLTDAGRALLANSPDPLQTQFTHRFDALKDWEQASLVSSLQRIAELLDAEALDAAAILEFGPLDPTTDKGEPE